MDETSIITATIKPVSEGSSIEENLEDVHDSDLQIESLMRELDSEIEELMLRASRIVEDIKTCTECTRKV